MTISSTSLLSRLYLKLGKRRRKQLWALIALSLFSAFADALSLSSVLPFLAVMASPEDALRQSKIIEFGNLTGAHSSRELLAVFTGVFITAALIAASFRILLLKYSNRFAFSCGSDISLEIYRRALYQPYQRHLESNSSSLISSVTTKVNTAVIEVFLPTLNLFSNGILILGITGTLFYIDPHIAFISSFGFASLYILTTFFFRRSLKKNGQLISEEQVKLVRVVQEGLGGIRDVIMDGTQEVFSKIYRASDVPLRRAQGNNIFIGQSPRHAIEALGIVFISLLAFSLMRAGGSELAFPILGALALGAQRLLPAIQYFYGSYTSISGNKVLLTEILGLLDLPVPAPSKFKSHLAFNENILLKNISFRYSNSSPWVVQDVTLDIKRGSRVGIVGTTGSGKSTLTDVFMGLLPPEKGEIKVDGQVIEGGLISDWQKLIAHVPQNVYLSDATFAENIAFGQSLEDIDFNLLHKVAGLAKIDEFIESREGGYLGRIGERGMRISGGQRQRIGIARALYKRATILILDEATSALDNSTEKSLMQSIDELSREYTMLIIAHRITTIQHCDKIIVLDSGRLISEGTYEQLMQDSPRFRELALSIATEKSPLHQSSL